MQSTTNTNLRVPVPLKVHGGDVADTWKRFREQWTNYEVASTCRPRPRKNAELYLTRALAVMHSTCIVQCSLNPLMIERKSIN